MPSSPSASQLLALYRGRLKNALQLGRGASNAIIEGHIKLVARMVVGLLTEAERVAALAGAPPDWISAAFLVAGFHDLLSLVRPAEPAAAAAAPATPPAAPAVAAAATPRAAPAVAAARAPCRTIRRSKHGRCRAIEKFASAHKNVIREKAVSMRRRYPRAYEAYSFYSFFENK
jgi:hypothetical protein